MDTDDLSKEAYYGILIEAERFNHDLTLYYGMLSYNCEGEDEYLSKSELLTKEIMSYSDAEIDDLFFGNPPERKALEDVLKKILLNIGEVKRLPLNKRTTD